MSDDLVVVNMARRDYGFAGVDERFPGGVVHGGQLLLAGDPRVQAAPHQWVAVGTADVATAMLIESMGGMATYDRLATKLGPVVAARDEQPRLDRRRINRGRGRPRGSHAVPRDQILATNARLRRSYGRPPTQEELAKALEPPVTVRTLRTYLQVYELGWPIE